MITNGIHSEMLPDKKSRFQENISGPLGLSRLPGSQGALRSLLYEWLILKNAESNSSHNYSVSRGDDQFHTTNLCLKSLAKKQIGLMVISLF